MLTKFIWNELSLLSIVQPDDFMCYLYITIFNPRQGSWKVRFCLIDNKAVCRPMEIEIVLGQDESR